MKRNNIILIIILLISVSIISCEKDTKDVSSVTTYPEMVLIGDQFMTIAKGSAFNDPGVKATIGGSPVAYTTTGNVDPSKEDVYTLVYTATNPEGFTQSIKRYVGVIASDAAALDISGNYKRTNGVMTTWTKSATYAGLYTTNNVGGVDPVTSPAWSFPVRIFNIKDSTLIVPSQSNPLGGEVYCTNISYLPSVGLGQVKWVVMGSGFGTSVRTFDKQ